VPSVVAVPSSLVTGGRQQRSTAKRREITPSGGALKSCTSSRLPPATPPSTLTVTVSTRTEPSAWGVTVVVTSHRTSSW
jgi:hypothetical protein